MEFKKVEFELPTYLITALNEVSKAMSMKPNQFLIHLLEIVWNAWDTGKEICRREASKVAEVRRTCIEKIVKHRSIIKKFDSWLDERGIKFESLSEGDENVIVEFLKEYQAGRQITRKTLRGYKRQLKNYLVCLSKAFKSAT